ncbi:MAG: glycogen debranching enzyme N-terminal domain-containing protein [Planctomycetota bacterium]|nr:glycogen debranching enzyme N-terminal domain-containing protein [Planctomycetota bacterium]MDA1106135.1 glycogen debranching enzyme N-terminal domain-containing protein [Planctomycetota bacterium]
MTVRSNEWLVTAGDGSYAMGTTSGIRTRRYHGLLMHAVEPTAVRRLLVTEVTEQVGIGDAWLDLGVRRWRDGSTSPDGGGFLRSFTLEAGIPTWVYELPTGRLVRRVFMEREAPVTQVTWEWLGEFPAAVRVAVLCVERDAHGSMRAGARTPAFKLARGGANAVWPAEDAKGASITLHARSVSAQFSAGTGWWMGQFLGEEAARGYDATEDVFHVMDVSFTMPPGTRHMLAVGAVEPARLDPAEAEAFQRQRSQQLAGALHPGIQAPFRESLALAADQFIVRHGTPWSPVGGLVSRATPGRSIIAGYPWFASWGRDTMLSIRGLLLLTGRTPEAEALLLQWAGCLHDGVLPNRLPDRAGEEVEVNSADAALLFVRAIGQLENYGGRSEIMEALLPSVREVVRAYRDGLPIGVQVDPADGLVHAAADGLQLTWMDAKCGDLVVTPRRGKPIELSALWHRACIVLSRLERRLGNARLAEEATTLAAHVRGGMQRYWSAERGFLADVLDGPGGDDWSLRPNQLFALVELEPALFPPAVRARALATLTRQLLAGPAVRTLDPSDPRYRGRYEGDIHARDAAYHNGTAWPFLSALVVEAVGSIGDGAVHVSAAALADMLLASGSVCEIVDGDAPHAARGCPMQAWSVAAAAEVLARRTIPPR